MPDRPLPPYMVYDHQLQARRRAVRTMAISAPLMLAAGALAVFGTSLLRGTALEYLLRGELLVLLAAPAVPFLLALASWLTSTPREELEAKWNGLRGWQRAAFGLVVVLIAAAVILGGVLLVLTRATAR